MTTGLLARAALTSSIYKRGVSLTGKARTSLPNSALVTHISTDVRLQIRIFATGSRPLTRPMHALS